jgi:hypothetical protein
VVEAILAVKTTDQVNVVGRGVLQGWLGMPQDVGTCIPQCADEVAGPAQQLGNNPCWFWFTGVGQGWLGHWGGAGMAGAQRGGRGGWDGGVGQGDGWSAGVGLAGVGLAGVGRMRGAGMVAAPQQMRDPSCIRMVQRNVSASSSNISASSRRQAVTRGQLKQKYEVHSSSRRIVACTNGLCQNSGWRTGVGSYAVAFPREELIAIL